MRRLAGSRRDLALHRRDGGFGLCTGVDVVVVGSTVCAAGRRCAGALFLVCCIGLRALGRVAARPARRVLLVARASNLIFVVLLAAADLRIVCALSAAARDVRLGLPQRGVQILAPVRSLSGTETSARVMRGAK
jgi:hypothetical protein